jgi:hypothetical protein
MSLIVAIWAGNQRLASTFLLFLLFKKFVYWRQGNNADD